MFEYLKSILKNPKLLTTYNTGLVQTRAYRSMRRRTADFLAPHGISSLEWAALGLLSESPKEGVRSMDLAEMLGVEQPFVTVITRNLTKLNLIEIIPSKADRRVKCLALSAKGHAFVVKMEKLLRDEMRPLIKNVSPRELLIYFKVLQSITQNALDIHQSEEDT